MLIYCILGGTSKQNNNYYDVLVMMLRGGGEGGREFNHNAIFSMNFEPNYRISRLVVSRYNYTFIITLKDCMHEVRGLIASLMMIPIFA